MDFTEKPESWVHFLYSVTVITFYLRPPPLEQHPGSGPSTSIQEVSHPLLPLPAQILTEIKHKTFLGENIQFCSHADCESIGIRTAGADGNRTADVAACCFIFKAQVKGPGSTLGSGSSPPPPYSHSNDPCHIKPTLRGRPTHKLFCVIPAN